MINIKKHKIINRNIGISRRNRKKVIRTHQPIDLTGTEYPLPSGTARKKDPTAGTSRNPSPTGTTAETALINLIDSERK
jgi:hypothetical protein